MKNGMRSAFLAAAAAFSLVLACSSDDAATDSGKGGGGGDSGGIGGEAPGLERATCQQTCAAPADCVPPNTRTLNDLDNYACVAGKCEWLGCNSTEECTESLGPAHVCDVVEDSAAKTCYPTCAAPADCVAPNAPPNVDEDNYECVGGRCEWTGCNSAEECTGPFASYVCTAAPGTSWKSCYPACTVPADCVIAGAPAVDDADNYACNNGICEWTGCNSTDECTASRGQNYVCE